MKRIRILIVDDEPLAHKVLESYCEKIDAVEVVGNCYDGVSTLNFLNEHEVDAVLLDIQMPDITGLDLIETIEKNSPKVIITTAYSEYALQSFNYDQVVDYLHKPIRLTRFIKSVARLRRLLLLEGNFTASSSIQNDETQSSTTDFISLRDNKVIYRIPYQDIKYVQSWGNYLKFFLEDQSVKIVRKTIKVAEAELPAALFLRIHKSYIVNLRHVKAIEGNHIKLDEETLPIGKSYSVSVRKSLTM